MWPRLPSLEAVAVPEADFYIWPTWKKWKGETTAAAQAMKAVATARLQQQSGDSIGRVNLAWCQRRQRWNQKINNNSGSL